MARLLKFELYKIFTRKNIYIALLLFLIIYGVYVSSNIGRPEGYESYRQWTGPVTGEKVKAALEGIDEINSKYNIKDGILPGNIAISPEDVTRMSVYSMVLDAEYRVKTRDWNLEVIKKDIEAMEQKGTKGYEYSVRKMEYNMIQNTMEPGIYFISGVSQAVDYTGSFGFIFMAAMVLLGLSPVFSEEYSTNMDALILSSKNGRNKTAGAKILSSVVYIAASALFFSGVVMLVNMYLYGSTGWDAPLQNMFKYLMSPYSLDIGQYYVIQFLFHTAGLVSFGFLVLLISSASKSSLVTIFAGGIIYIVPLVANSLLSGGPGWLLELAKFGFSEFAKVENIFRWFKAYDIFGFPILYPAAAVFVMIALSFLCIHYICKTYTKHEVTG